MFFTIPEVIPIPVPGYRCHRGAPHPRGVRPNGHRAEGDQTASFLLKRSVPRKAVVTAVRAIVPVLERVKKLRNLVGDGQRHHWRDAFLEHSYSCSPSRLLFRSPASTCLTLLPFVIAFGLVENDGLIVMAGVIVGLISLAILGGVVFGLFSFLGFSGL
jgi:hypothetical protein